MRVPAVQGEFVERDAAGALDFGAMLPALDTAPFEFEAWGWQAGALVSLGKGTYTPPPPSTQPGGLTFGGGPPQLSGATLTSLSVIEEKLGAPNPVQPSVRTEGEFCFDRGGRCRRARSMRPEVGSTEPLPKTFRWQTKLTDVSQFVWQILPYPPANSADLAPPFLIDEDVVALEPGQTEGEFSIDFNKYFKSSVPTLPVSLGSRNSSSRRRRSFLASSSATPSPAPTSGTGTGRS